MFSQVIWISKLLYCFYVCEFQLIPLALNFTRLLTICSSTKANAFLMLGDEKSHSNAFFKCFKVVNSISFLYIFNPGVQML